MTSNRPNKRRVCLGAFAGAHGVKGEARVKTFTARPENVAAYGPVESEDGKRRFTLQIVRVLKPDLVLVRATKIASREDAAALAGTKLYVDRAALPEPDDDEFYIEDLVGLAAFTEDGAALGEVVAVHNFGAGNLIEIAKVAGEKGPLMLLFTRDSVPEIDLARGKIVVRPPDLDTPPLE